MIVTRIEQRRRFPPKPDCRLTHICEETFDKIIEMIFKKHGMKDREEARQAMELCLKYGFNAYYDELYSEQISCVLQSDPNFFEKLEQVL